MKFVCVKQLYVIYLDTRLIMKIKIIRWIDAYLESTTAYVVGDKSWFQEEKAAVIVGR